MLNNVHFSTLVCRHKPISAAKLAGSRQYPEISGTVRFYAANPGVLVVAEVFGLPASAPGEEAGFRYGPFYAFHLHQGGSCGGGEGKDPFQASGGHYTPTEQPHPFHAGDFPPLLGNGGYAYMSFYTARLQAEETVGRTVIVHKNADDFHTQPSGNAGEKIACGVVYAVHEA